jgi:hypothetical protein
MTCVLLVQRLIVVLWRTRTKVVLLDEAVDTRSIDAVEKERDSEPKVDTNTGVCYMYPYGL